ncbi:hatching enzyme 1.2-like [Ischnura elegans]|uniref:hatching enzyme 1.2-like n=1 Tax=Ischnura elegans TaxID=197161 RepID=UPI001ED8796B|nr:hatching enzyme 1.2-like [Ischnura elegans]
METRLKLKKRTGSFKLHALILSSLPLYFVLLPCIMGKTISKPPITSFPPIPDVIYPPIPEEVKISLTEEEKELLAYSSDPEVRPALFEGDMALSSEAYDYWRVGIRWDVFPEKLWKNRTVPYVISPLYDPADHVTIYTAIQTLNFMTCIKFVPWDGKRKDFLLIWPIKFPKGCWSFVGRTGGTQIVSLQPPDRQGPNCLGGPGRAIHELLHALGIFHEQSRADRDKFVKVHFDNIIPQFLVNFDKQSLKNTTYSFEYDYDSIMHYGENFFSKGRGMPTITPKHPGARLGQRKALSKTDCLKVNELYGCLKKSAADSRRYHTICNVLGL